MKEKREADSPMEQNPAGNNKNGGPGCISFVGWSGGGKTTLVSAIVGLAASRGLIVGAVKATHAELKFDAPGTDSSRFADAGARRVLILAKDREVLICRKKQAGNDLQRSPEDAIERSFSHMDLVLCEGPVLEGAPLFEVTDGRESLKYPAERLSGIVGAGSAGREEAEAAGIPWFDRSTPELLFQYFREQGFIP
ncbi:MAG: molybdopterin-guanine dinucleotide biosynthesis protein MobB [Spirochaetales bacterium]|nr:molybdopterin-guanine dinucleotide biosynthesis protein MobB [Spirochaetales bacterium]MCF7939001.1 molybdopterin-guanine dinucleotide biosynthesis protein MobB [Spirochaetales bacterium]